MDPEGGDEEGRVRVVTPTVDVLAGLMASDGAGVAYLDQDLRLRSWNSSWVERLGLSGTAVDELMGAKLGRVLPSLAPWIEAQIGHLLGGGSLHLEEVPFEGADETVYADLLLIPLMQEGDPQAFLNLVMDVGDRAAAREGLERALLSYRRELSALRDVMSAAAESLELRDVLRRLLDHVLRVMKSKVGAIHLFDEQQTVLKLVAARGISRRVAARIEAVDGSFDAQAWATEPQEPSVSPSTMPSLSVAAEDVSEIADPLRRPVSGGRRGEAVYMGVPVRSRGEILGLISVVGPAGRVFDDGDVTLLRSIGDQIGVVVENARLYRQAEQLAVVRERERLARELHDSVTQSLYSLTLLAEASQRWIGGGEADRAVEYVARLGEIAQQALKEMRLLVYQLRPLVLKREGLVGALQHRLDAVERRAGVDARLLVQGALDLPAGVEVGLYRIAQEALNNALKHAAPSSVILRVRADRRHVRLEVVDDGRGFDPTAVVNGGGMGLISMEERAERMGGSFTLDSAPGHGTTVRVDVEVAR